MENSVLKAWEGLEEAHSSKNGTSYVEMRKGDYRGADGLIYCGKCHEAREQKLFVPLSVEGFNPNRQVRRRCACDRAEDDRMETEAKGERARKEIQRLRETGLMDAQYKECRFANDDGQSPEASRICRAFVEKWDEIKSVPNGGGGLILWGAPGGGKTFFASCIANGLIEKQIPVIMDTIPRLAANMAKDFKKDRERILDDLKNVPLLILDDFGIERDTSSAKLDVYEIINERYKAKKPLVITTNLTLDAIKAPKTADYMRIYSRIQEMCPYAVKVEPRVQRRQQAAGKKYAEMQAIFGDATAK